MSESFEIVASFIDEHDTCYKSEATFVEVYDPNETPIGDCMRKLQMWCLLV